jgi:hypothetical protein
LDDFFTNSSGHPAAGGTLCLDKSIFNLVPLPFKVKRQENRLFVVVVSLEKRSLFSPPKFLDLNCEENGCLGKRHLPM